MPSYDELAASIAELAGRLDNLPLSSLPLGDIQRKLENDWQPDAAVLLQPNSISTDQLVAGIRPQASTGTLVWPGGSVVSTALVVKHSLGVIPRVIVSVGSCSGLTLIPAIQVFGRTATQFSVQANTVDAQTPLATATTEFNWLAIG